MTCPNCGKELKITQEKCDGCGFDFNETLSCPYKVSNRCIFNQEKSPCDIQGLNFEDCLIYLHKAGLSS